ncbi:MAG: hypothetical protein JW716_02570 [Candidatus Aenigmarchaeota archaeon]|nr:hypothetical protein [Candidatus Aenigmarchaeota archaeon]
MKKIFTGLFNNWDSIVNSIDTEDWSRKYSHLRDIILAGGDTETLISKNEFDFLLSRVREKVKTIGGNGANAAVALSEAGITPVMSCPARTRDMLEKLQNCGIKIAGPKGMISPADSIISGEDYEHIAVENGNFRHLFTYDKITEECVLDYDFLRSLKSADLLWISGFHLVSGDFKNRIKELGDLLEDRMFKIHLELGRGTNMMEFAFKYLTKRNAINSLGFDESEIDIIGIKPHKMNLKDGLEMVSEKNNIEKVVLHTSNFVSTFSIAMNDKFIEAAERAVDMTAAKSLGFINENMKMEAKELPLSGLNKIAEDNFMMIPARINPNPKQVTGLGDCFSVLDFYYSFS